MIEVFRKYSGFAFVLLILLFLGLVFMVDGVGRNGIGTGPKLMSYDGRSYTESEVQRQGADYSSMFQAVTEFGNRAAYVDITPYAYNVLEQDPRDYLANRLLLKQLVSDFGLEPSQEQIEAFVKEVLFTDQNGEFDQVSYLKYIEKRVKRLGLGVQDFNILVGEIISIKKLENVVGRGAYMSEEATRRGIKITGQEISYEQYSLSLAKLREGITVTEDEVKSYWEENKNSYLTETQAKVQYVVADANVTALEATKLAEAKEAAKKEGKSEEEINKITYSLPEEEKNALINTVGDKVDRLFVNVQDADGKNFSEIATKLELETKTTELFSRGNAPFEFKLPLYQAQGDVLTELFKLTSSGETMESLSNVFPIGEGRFLIFQVLERKEAEPLAYEVAKARAEVDLIDERAANALEDEATKLRDTLSEKVKTIAPQEAAKELGLTFAKKEKATIASSAQGDPTARELFSEAIKVSDNEFSEPIIQNTLGSGLSRAVIIRPLSRQYINTEENKSAMERQVEGGSGVLQRVLFEGWFTNALDNVLVEKF